MNKGSTLCLFLDVRTVVELGMVPGKGKFVLWSFYKIVSWVGVMGELEPERVSGEICPQRLMLNVKLFVNTVWFTTPGTALRKAN